ncbi:MAG TPA: nuclear transport factor 2 family protein [Actinomycetes bacterium]|nr:nuclear transport factor 2 family protein [Actinomycetes bacterium]
MSQADVDVARAAFAAFAARDLDALGELLHHDIWWHTPGRSQISGDFHGRAAVLGYLRRVLELTDGTQQVVPVDLLVGRGHVAALVDVTGERHGRRLHDRALQLLAFRDGKIVLRRVYPEDQAAFDAFWSS